MGDGNDGFIFYPSFIEQIEAINDEVIKGYLYRAVAVYGCTGEMPDFSDIDPIGMLKGLFLAMKRAIDDQRRRREIQRRNGAKGGAPKGSRNNPNGRRKTNQELTETNQELTETNQELTETNLNKDKEKDKDKEKLLSSTTTETRTCVREAAAAAVASDKDFIENFFKDKSVVEDYCKHNSISPEQLRRLVEETVNDWRLTGQTHADEQEAREHLVNTLRIKISKTYDRNKFGNQNEQYSPSGQRPPSSGVPFKGKLTPAYGLKRPDGTDRFSERRGTEPGTKSRKGFNGTF